MPRKKDASRQAHMKTVLSIASEKKAKEKQASLADFINTYYAGISDADLLQRRPQDLSGGAIAHRDFATGRKRGETRVRLYNPTTARDGWKSAHTICQTVTDDMPFLVDSLSMAFTRHNIGIHLTVHPIFRVLHDRDRPPGETAAEADQAELVESFIHIEVDRQKIDDDLKALEADVRKTLQDVRDAVTDWQAMREKMHSIVASTNAGNLPLDKAETLEATQFLEWLISDHFTFLGYREYDLVQGDDGIALHILAGSGLGILRHSGSGEVSQSFQTLPKDIRDAARKKEFVMVTKANSVATVHRPAYMDYIGIKRFSNTGEIIGEHRFFGLFTSTTYRLTPQHIPLLRIKVAAVLRRSQLSPTSHDGKALTHILENIPRDELFQTTVNELYTTATGVLALQERRRTRLFIRRDRFGRFYSCLIYLPRNRHNTGVRKRIEAILNKELNGSRSESTVQLSESKLASIHTVVHTTPREPETFTHDVLEHLIRRVVRSWEDELRDALPAALGDRRGTELYRRYGKHFHAAYKEDVTPKAAVHDIKQLDKLTNDDSLQMNLYQPQRNASRLFRLRLFRREQPIAISTALPMLENLGMTVISEQPYQLALPDEALTWIQDFEMIYAQQVRTPIDKVKALFQEAFTRIWDGDAESDGFNYLVLGAQLSWRETALLRAYCKYLLQTGAPFSQTYMARTLATNPDIAALLVELFHIRFDPDRTTDDRDENASQQLDELHRKLDDVSSLDDDRILRGFLTLIDATLRTNYYQTEANGKPKHYIAFKLDSGKIPELPLPRPMVEVFVYSTRFEAVHLRGGPVARGGIRWSDRHEDFRTEVLGLMKAQMVKNTVIVPVGSKGGFVIKRPPQGGRDEIKKEVKACYQDFMRGMLDFTDNIVDGAIQPPPRVVRHDPDDPYLVVAADKGTAGFSDLANGVAAEYGYWLDDAFASGGSAGYDHKEMGITARGGWESVKRHFRELDKDIQNTDFTAVGIGDMAGDVFGNGMLRSPHTRLVAAFNHLHIFLDPNPDAKKSFKERQRLYELPRSSWEDYDARLISKGGGVFSRDAKSIALSPNVRKVLDTDAKSLPPHALIRVILKAPVDLLWNGGIGTYVKARRETSADVGDRANDLLRINGRDLRCQVVGEGGNLGFTQLGRIEYATNGGRINTDFVDNSAGVNCSDHEVNIKILLNMALAKGNLDMARRKKLLASMTNEIADLVLRNNYVHSQAVSITQAQAIRRLGEHAYLIRSLERSGILNRAIEFLPDDDEIAERRTAGKGLTRPEIAVLLAYSKITINTALVNSDVPEDDYLHQGIINYFPTPLRSHFDNLMGSHRLQREIITTTTTNSMVNRMGPTFVPRLQEETGMDAATIARAYTIAREAYNMPSIWKAIEDLDNQVAAATQVDMLIETTRLLRHATRWLLDARRQPLDISAYVTMLQPGITTLENNIQPLLPDAARALFDERDNDYRSLGVPESLAVAMAGLNYLYAGLDIVEVARDTQLDVTAVATVYYLVGNRLDLGWLHEQVDCLLTEGHWQAVARGSLREDLYAQQRKLVSLVVQTLTQINQFEECVDKWLKLHRHIVDHNQRVIDDMKNGDSTIDFATLTVALQKMRQLVDASGQ